MRKICCVILLVFIFSSRAAVAQYIIHIAGNNIYGVVPVDGGPALNSSLNQPTGICRDSTGNLYIGDAGNGTVRKITAATGIITTVAGGGLSSATADNIPATSAYITAPFGICLDKTESNLYIADDRSRIRKVNIATGAITTAAGTITPGYTGDNGPATAAGLGQPADVCIDTAGNIYLADYGNHAIRRVDAVTGIISTVAGIGSPGFSGDNGPATAAKLDYPEGVYVDKNNNLYIADRQNNRVRKVDAGTGNIATIAGTGAVSYSGDGGPATAANLYNPIRVNMDKMGNIYISEYSGVRLRKINAATGIITTFAGNGSPPPQWIQ